MTNQQFTAADLVVGKTYRVISAFEDYDGITHEVGECWRFLTKNFLPYEDGLTLQVEKGGGRNSIRLQWRPETQAHLIEHFSDYVVETSL